jgi:alkanesulfonate monooxygenase SsuD/methylene tetrahydromethanopterin reductase-like flavin-dependent oxidoreductase (luciferase family)
MSDVKRISGIGGYGGRRLANKLGRVGAWSFALQRLTARDELAAARAIEAQGYPVIWMPESLGSKDVMAHSAILLGGTGHVAIAPGIASIHARDPMSTANAARALGEAWPDRFILGLGVSHAPSVKIRGGDYASH